jgi:hypothetical protein
MRRALIALVLAPLLVSSVFGIFALLAFPWMLLMTIVVALPLLLLFQRIGRLNWWIAVMGGAICALGYITLEALAPLTYGVAPNADRLINSNNIAFLGLGMLTGFVFWWIGIFKNTAFPFVSRRFPASALLVVPLALTCAGLNHWLRESDLTPCLVPFRSRVRN